MAGEVAQAYVRLRPNAAGFQREAEAQVQGALGGLRKSAAFLIGAGGIAEGVKGILEAASGKQSAVAQIQTAVHNAGAEWKVYGETVAEALDKQENKSGFDFEELAQGFGRLEQQTKNSGQSLKLLGVAEDVARGRHLDLAQVTVALSRAQAGNSQSLSRLGIVIPKYTANVDALKGKLLDIEKAEQATAQSRAKVYEGTVKLTAEQQRLAALNPVQLAQLKDQIKAQEASATAADKRASAEQAVGEVTRRYAGQTAAYANTAAGSYARFRVAVQQVAEEIGTVALPQLTDLAQNAARVALELSNNAQVGRVTAGVLDDIAGGAQAVVTAFHAVEPALRIAAETAQAIGPGPILATYAAYKLLSKGQALATIGEAKYAALVKAGTPARVAAAAATDAKAASDAAAIAAGAPLIAFEEALAEGYSAQTAAVAANNGATVTNTELTTLNLAAKIRSGEIQALMAEGYSATTAATIANNGALISNTELLAANTLAAEADTAAQIELRGATVAGSAATTGWRAALAGLGTKLTGPTGIVAAVALAAGGIYYLSTVQSEAHRRTVELTDALDAQNEAQRSVRQTARDQQTTASDNGSAIRARADATDQLASSRAALDKLLAGSSYTAGQVADAQRRIADSEAQWRGANQRVIDTENAKREAVTKAKDAITDQRKAVADLATAEDRQADAFRRRALGAKGGDGTKQLSIDAANYAVHLRDVAATSKTATDAQRFNLRALADYIDATGKIPDSKVLHLSINDTAFYDTLQKDLGVIRGAGQALLDAFTGGAAQAAGARGGVSIPVDDGKTKELGAKTAETFSTSFVQHLDASGIGSAFTDAITQAQAQLVSETGTLATTIGTALDAKLKAQTLPATQEIARLQAQIAASQAASQARDTGQAVADAQKKLADLQRVFGSGALTSDQQQQISQASVALADAQDQAAAQGKQNRIAELQAGIDTAGKANEAAKAAASRRLADLSAELNDGLITQRTYVKRLNALLASEGVNYKTTGKLLGQSFADGFRDGLSSVVAQAAALGGVGQRTLRGAGRGTTAINPAKAEADAIKAFLDQVAGSNGRFDVTGAGNLPPGVTLASLLAQASSQRSADTYRTKDNAKTDRGLEYQGATRDHTAQTVAELKRLNRQPIVVNVTVDGKKAKRKTAEATRS